MPGFFVRAASVDLVASAALTETSVEARVQIICVILGRVVLVGETDFSASAALTET